MENKDAVQFEDENLSLTSKDSIKENPITPTNHTPIVTPVNQPINMIGMIQRAAADPSTDIAKMETLWKMKKEIDAKEAETAFSLAMGIAQSQMTFIQNDCYNPQTESRYASYKQLDKVLRPIYTSNGFALSFNIEPTSNDDLINVICYVTHKNGHSRTYSIPIPNDGKGPKGNPVMTKAHATGGASSYGMRYLLKMIFNVAVGEEDFDGNNSTNNVELISEEQQNKIHSMIAENDLSMSIFLSWLDRVFKNKNGISGIPVEFYQKIIDKLNDTIKKRFNNS